jgi:hypothetical protein
VRERKKETVREIMVEAERDSERADTGGDMRERIREIEREEIQLARRDSARGTREKREYTCERLRARESKREQREREQQQSRERKSRERE